jgi:hypothetical protein
MLENHRLPLALCRKSSAKSGRKLEEPQQSLVTRRMLGNHPHRLPLPPCRRSSAKPDTELKQPQQWPVPRRWLGNRPKRRLLLLRR